MIWFHCFPITISHAVFMEYLMIREVKVIVVFAFVNRFILSRYTVTFGG